MSEHYAGSCPPGQHCCLCAEDALRQELATTRVAAEWMFWRLSSWDGREALTQWPWLAEKAGGAE